MNDIKLTIGISTIPSRMFDDRFLPKLVKKIEKQIGDREDVEVIVLGDNKKVTVGRKRDRIVQMAQGKFVVHVDDDDDISDDYIETVCDIIEKNPNIDVISHSQKALINGEEWTVDFSLDYDRTPPLDQLKYVNGVKAICKRPPFSVCPFRTELAKKVRFIDFSSGEDCNWSSKMWEICKNEYKTDKKLHIYVWNSKVSEAPLRNKPNKVSTVAEELN